MKKAQSDLKDIKDKKLFLHGVHEKSAEKYDGSMAKREYSNKISKYRRIVQSYATGDVLEIGIGTGTSLKYYKPDAITSFIGIDWSPNMLNHCFQKIDEMKM